MSAPDWTPTSLLPPHLTASSPSFRDGVPALKETRHRAWGCVLLLSAARMLRRSHVVGATAQALLQRFYFRKSLRRFDVFAVAMGCLLLAMKVEEELVDARLLRELLFAFERLYQRRKALPIVPMALGGARYSVWKSRLMTVERHILKELGFVFYGIIDHPHKYVLSLRNHLGLPSAIAGRAFAVVNDSLCVDLGLRYPGPWIAAAAVHLAAAQLRAALPEGWWKLAGCGAEDIGRIVSAILGYYDMVEGGEVDGWLEPLAEDSIVAEKACREMDAENEARGALLEDGGVA